MQRNAGMMALSVQKNSMTAMPGVVKGFTLIELVVTMVVAGILAAGAIPFMSNFISQTRLSGNVNEFIAATMLARSEAIQRNGAVTICRSSGAETGSNACDTGANDWSSGWLVYVGTSSDTPSATGPKNLILARQGAFASGTIIAPAPAATAITYAASGVPWPAPPASFGFTFNSNFSRIVCFSPSGRTSALQSGKTAANCP